MQKPLLNLRTLSCTTALLLLTGCAQLLGPTSKVPFFKQEDGHCGDSALMMVLRYHGQKIDEVAVREMVYLPALKGTIPEIIADTARKLGFESEVTQLDIAGLKQLVARTGPTIVYFGADAAPGNGHFLVVNDISSFPPRICVHTGEHADHWMDTKEFARRWRLGDHIVVRVSPVTGPEADRVIPRFKSP